jgi:hypothetical protein
MDVSLRCRMAFERKSRLAFMPELTRRRNLEARRMLARLLR